MYTTALDRTFAFHDVGGFRLCRDPSILKRVTLPTLPNFRPPVRPRGNQPVSPRVLVVDDDPAICQAYDEILRARGYLVSTAMSHAEAMAEIERLNGAVDVLILDISLPDADGAQVSRDITARIGARPTVYVSGWSDEFWDLSDAPGKWIAIQKPVPIPRLIASLDWLSGRRDVRHDLS